MKNNYLLTCLMLLPIWCSAQSGQMHYAKLEIKEKEVFIVGPGNMLTVDTLIMHDRSTIKFSSDTPGVLKANVAIVGSKCEISSRGGNGLDSELKKRGTRGRNGGDLDITMHFDKLKSLTIDTRGGTGGDGLDGKNGKNGIKDRQEKKIIKGPKGEDIVTYELIPGTRGTDGTNATTGLPGGNGGNISFTYSTNKFIPVFNHAKARNSITLLHTVGDAGRDGTPGKGGFQSADGVLEHIKKVDSADGQIRLYNANTASAHD
jgi:hypothetical protein